METRLINDGEIELRTVAGKPTIVGYAAKYNAKSRDLGGFYEIIAPGAFDRTLADPNNDVVAKIEHMGGLMILARTSNGSLKLESNATGLKYTITNPPDTSAARDLIVLLREGLITKSSFAFSVAKGGESWDDSGKTPIRTLRDVNLHDVSPVSDPAYTQSTVSVRAFEDFKNEKRFARLDKA